MGFSNHAENNILNHVFGGGDYARPATLQVGLSITEVEDDGTGITEPVGGYARLTIDNDTTTWNLAETAESGEYEGKGIKTTAIDLEFDEATEDWGEITHFFIMAGADLIGHGELYQPKQINAGDVARFRPGELIITLD